MKTNIEITLKQNDKDGGRTETLGLDGLIFAGRVNGDIYSKAGMMGSMDADDIESLLGGMVLAVYGATDQSTAVLLMAIKALSKAAHRLQHEDDLDKADLRELKFIENEMDSLEKRLTIRLAMAAGVDLNEKK